MRYLRCILLLMFVFDAQAYAAPLNTYSSFGGVSALGPDALRCLGTSATNPCSNATQTLTYDVNGSVSTAQSSAGIASYQYNHDNKLLRSSDSNHTVENIYGPRGERVATIEDGNTTFLFENGLEVGVQGSTQSYFFKGERMAMKDRGRDTRFFLSDHLSSVRAVTDSHGTVLTRSNYYPFGDTMSQSGITSFDSNYKFNGNRSDPTGVYDYNARSMNPVVARFLQPDSIIPDEKDPQSLNRYAYVQNNPLKLRDPSGHLGVGTQAMVNVYGGLLNAVNSLNQKFEHAALGLMGRIGINKEAGGVVLMAASMLPGPDAEELASGAARLAAAGIGDSNLGRALFVAPTLGELKNLANSLDRASIVSLSERTYSLVVRELRQSGTPEALATAKLLSTGRVEMISIPRIPGVSSKATTLGAYHPGESSFDIFPLQHSSAQDLARTAAHETYHYVQDREGVTEFFERGAHAWEQLAMPSNLSVKDASVWGTMRDLFGDDLIQQLMSRGKPAK